MATPITCLDNLIGADLGCSTSTGRLFLKDVGITRKELQSYTAEEDATLAEFIDRIRRAAIARLEAEFTARMAARMIGRSFLDRARIGALPDAPEELAGDANTQGGIAMEFDIRRANVALHITTVGLFVPSSYSGSGTEVLTITDLDTGQALATANLTATAGQLVSNEVDLLIQAPRRRMRLLAWHGALEYMRTQVNAADGSCTTCTGWGNFGEVKAYGARIGKATTKYRANLQRTDGHGSGLSITASLACDHAATLCEMKAALALPLLHAMASEAIGAGIANAERLNTRTLDREELERRRMEHEAKMEHYTSTLLAGIPLPKGDPCWACNPQTRHAVAIP